MWKVAIMNKLYGRRVLHVMSPVKFDGNVFNHEGDSNYKVMEMTISYLPDCHHYILVPENNKIVDTRKNVTLLPFNYPKNAVSNRSQFDTKAFLSAIDMKNMDFDFLFIHQPELIYNVLVALMDKRYGEILHKFAFYHWIDCPASRGSPAIPHGYMRQLEAINLSTKIFVHSSESIKYMLTNFKKPKSVTLNLPYIKEKVQYMPLSSGLAIEQAQLQIPTNKPIVVFNHRWRQSTGINRFLEYTESIKDKYLFVITDSTAEDVPDGYYVVPKSLNSSEYATLLRKCHATVCFVDDYATWNLSVQDGIMAGQNTYVYKHPVMEHVLGTDFPCYFETKEDFQKMLTFNKQVENGWWTMPNHSEVFQHNLCKSMEDCISNTDSIPKDGPNWIYCILNGLTYKGEITGQVQPTIGLNSVWQYIRRWMLANGVVDDPNSPYPCYSIASNAKEKLEKMVENIKMDIRPGDKKKPIMIRKDNPFF